MSGEVELKGSIGSRSFKTNTRQEALEESGPPSREKGKVESSSKGNISASLGTPAICSTGCSSLATNTNSSINTLDSQSQSFSNKHAVNSNTSSSLAVATTGESSTVGKCSSTLFSSGSNNPAVEGDTGTGNSVPSASISASTFPAYCSKDSDTSHSESTTTNTASYPSGSGGGGIVDGSTSSTLTSNPSIEGKSHQNNQNPQQQEKACQPSSLSARLSLKNLGRRRSPVRTQFILPNEPSSGTTGTDQIPKDSISAPAQATNTSSGGSGNSRSCGSTAGGQSSRGLLKSSKDRGASSSPPLQRAQPQSQPPGASLSSCKASSSSAPINPPSSASNAPRTTTTITFPADPSIPFVPGTSASVSVDRAQSVKITRKILHNWRSACGRTKDRTKDLIRRWKTLPENHADFEQLPKSPNTSRKKGGSTLNLNSNSPQTKKKLQTVKSAEGSSGPSGTKHEREVPSVISSELQSSKGSKLLSVGHQRTENEMPVVGSGKGLGDSSASGAPNISSSGVNRLTPAMTGVGRPSISVNNTNVVNGRTIGTDSGSGNASGQTSGQPKSSTGWTVHVWATYVQRDDLEQGLDNEEPKKPDREHLSDFQKVKLTHFFRHVLDMNHDDVISAEDFVALNQRIRHYIEWSSECIEFHILKEVHSGFLECFLNQPLDECSVMYYCNSERETRQNVNIDEWLDVWGGLLKSARTMEALPLWLQYFPKILFQVINKSGSGTISREELRAFYTMFLGIDFRVVNETLESIHKAMTDGGRHKITYDLFKLCFANFLLGKYPNGPGQYLFGICSPQTLECSFPIDYSALNTHPDDLEPYDPEKDKSQSNRRSVIV